MEEKTRVIPAETIPERKIKVFITPDGQEFIVKKKAEEHEANLEKITKEREAEKILSYAKSQTSLYVDDIFEIPRTWYFLANDAECVAFDFIVKDYGASEYIFNDHPIDKNGFTSFPGEWWGHGIEYYNGDRGGKDTIYVYTLSHLKTIFNKFLGVFDVTI